MAILTLLSIYEQYQDDDALDAHRASSHFQQYAISGLYQKMLSAPVENLLHSLIIDRNFLAQILARKFVIPSDEKSVFIKGLSHLVKRNACWDTVVFVPYSGLIKEQRVI